MKKFAVCILSAMLALGLLPLGLANAAAAVSGKITGLNCGSGIMAITYTTKGDTMQVKITGSTTITVNGAQATCGEISVGMIATASGELEDGILVATSISALGTQEVKTFRLNVKITGLGCPASLTGITQYGSITFDISNASITRNGQGIPCSELQVGDSAVISGEKQGNAYVADTVSATSATESFTITGTISSVNCPEITVTSSGQSFTFNVSSASITINNYPSSCAGLKTGMTVTVSGQKVGSDTFVKIVKASMPKTTFSVVGKVLNVSCQGSGKTMMVSTSLGEILVDVTFAYITRNGIEIFCTDLKPGDEVEIAGEFDGMVHFAKTIVVKTSGPQPFSATGKITKLECPSITVETTHGSISMGVAGAQIKINNVYSSCSDLKVGDTAIIIGTVLGTVYSAKSIVVTRSTDPTPPNPPPPTPPDPQPTPPNTQVVNGKVMVTNCQGNSVVIETGNGQVNLPLLIPFTRNGSPATCANIQVGDTVKVSIEVEGNNSKIAKIEFFTGSDSQETTFDAEIVALDCNSRMIVLKKADESIVSMLMDQACQILLNGNASTCAGLGAGMLVTVTTKQTSVPEVMTAIRISAKTTVNPDLNTYSGIIVSTDCQNGKMRITHESTEIDVFIGNALISIDGTPAPCDKLKAGLKVTVKGKIIDSINIIAVQIDAQTATSTDCNGPFAITGTLELADCANKTIIVKVGSVLITVKFNDSTVFTSDGQAIDCTKLQRGDTVEVSGECTPETGMVAKIVNKKAQGSEPGTTLFEGTVLSIDCKTGNMVVASSTGLPVMFKFYNTTEFYVNGQKVVCNAITPGMKVKITFKVENGTKVATKVEATITDNGGGGSGGGGGGNPPTPPPGGGGGGGGNPPPPPDSGAGGGSGGTVKTGDPYQSVVTVESFDCATGTIKGSDEYNSGRKVVISLTSVAGFFYKQEKINCGKVKPGYLVKVIGKYGSTDATKVNADSIEILPVSPVKFAVFGRIIEINNSTGIIQLEKITNTQSETPTIQSTSSTLPGDVFTIKIDPATTFEYRGEKLTVKDLRVGIIMNVDGLLDPVNNSMTTSNFMLAARQAVAVTETGIVADVFCDKNLFWIAKDSKPDSKYILIRMSAQTEITVNGTKATCADITKGSSITISGKLDPFDLFVIAESVSGQFEKEKSSTVEGEVVSVDIGRGFFWIKVEDAQGIRYAQVKFTAETKIIVFGKIGTASDLATVGMVSVTGHPELGNPFVVNAGSVETTGKIIENLSASGTVVFTDCSSKVLFVKTATGVERFELTAVTKLTSGDKISACTDILEGMAVSLTYDKKGTRTVVTKIMLPLPKTVIKLTVGLGAMSINGKNQLIDAPPYIKNGTTMVPLRVVSEAFGASITWNQSDKRITIQKGSKIIICWVDRTDALVGGVTMPMKVSPEQDKSSRTMVPIRFMSELFGAEVLWDQTSKMITITM